MSPEVSAELLGRLAAVAGVVFDVDGCLVLSDEPGGSDLPNGRGPLPLPGAADALAAVRRSGRPLVAFTNASNQPPAKIAAGLQAAGLPVTVDEVLTPAVVAAEVIRQRYAGGPVLAFGGPGLTDVLTGAGIQLVTHHRPAAVVIGWDIRFGHEHLQLAAEAVWNGADLLVTSDAPRFASRRGPRVGVAGFIGSGLTHITGRRYEVLGKPSATAMAVAAQRLRVPAERILVVGDDLTLEARMARAAGAVGVLVTTGLYGTADLVGAPAADRPDLVVAGLPDLLAILDRADRREAVA